MVFKISSYTVFCRRRRVVIIYGEPIYVKEKIPEQEAEKKAYFVQRKFLKKIKYHTAIKWLDKQYKNKWWKSMDKDKKSADHFRKLLEDYQKKKLKIKKLKDIKL